MDFLMQRQRENLKVDGVKLSVLVIEQLRCCHRLLHVWHCTSVLSSAAAGCLHALRQVSQLHE